MAVQSSSKRNWLIHWLGSAWLGWLALVLLLVVMTQLVQPRINRFVEHWYALPANSPYATQAAELRELREHAVIRRAWLIGAAPVALLFFFQLVLSRRKVERKEGEALSKNAVDIEYLKPGPISDSPVLETAYDGSAYNNTIAYDTNQLIHNAEQTQVRRTDASPAMVPHRAQSSLESSLEGDGALYIGPGGRYRIDRLLASGGMGSVHKGFDKTLQRDVAIKELDVSLAQDQEQTDRFRQEALALAGLAHPHIVPVYDLLEDNNRFWIVMELLSGGDLEDRIQKKPPSPTVASNIIRAVAEGLVFAHNKGIVHRDIKPMNILFTADGIPKLVDFGIAKLMRAQQSVVHTREGLSLGSPTYMSPEQVKGKKDIDKRADIYALGITFYKILVGEAPFTGDVDEVMRQHIFESPKPPRELNDKVSDELNTVVLKMLEKKVEDRYQSLEEFIAALAAMKKS